MVMFIRFEKNDITYRVSLIYCSIWELLIRFIVQKDIK